MSRLDLRGTVEQLLKKQDTIDVKEVRKDPRLRHLLEARPSQINTWVDNNVNTIADFKMVLKIILKVLLIMARKVFR